MPSGEPPPPRPVGTPWLHVRTAPTRLPGPRSPRGARAGPRESGDAEAAGDELETGVGLHDGDADEARAVRSIELTGRHQGTPLGGQTTNEGPGVTVGRRGPEVEATGGERHVAADGAQDLGKTLETMEVPGPLLVDGSLVGPRGNGGGLHRTGNHFPGGLADLREVV